MNKAELKRFAEEVRQEAGVDIHGPFDPYELADAYGIDVYRLGEAGASAIAQAHFAGVGIGEFSGALIPMAPGAIILDNDHHDPHRRRATVAHEMAHVLREHQFTPTLVNEHGCRVADAEQELEAKELGAELLLPAEAARALAARGSTDHEVARLHRVSIHLARWRMNATGARIIAKRSMQKRGGAT